LFSDTPSTLTNLLAQDIKRKANASSAAAAMHFAALVHVKTGPACILEVFETVSAAIEFPSLLRLFVQTPASAQATKLRYIN
jgi:hypothetical protein